MTKWNVMPEVTIYSTKSCPYCQMEKEYLDEKGIKYTNYYVDGDQEKAQEMIEISGQMGVPFTVIKADDGQEHYVLGFQKEKLNEILGID